MKVVAGVKKEVVVQKSSDHFNISVREKAEMNMANRRVIQIIAEYFKLPVAKIRIISGHHNPSKILSVNITE